MEHVRTVTREFETGDKAVLHVEARSGTVTVETHGSPSIHVEAIIRIWSDQGDDIAEAGALVERGMSQDDQRRVIIRAPSLPQSEGWAFWGKRGARVDFVIKTPGRTAVRVLSRSGRVEVLRIEGRVHIESGSGRVRVADINGDVELVTRSGSLLVERVRGDVQSEARSARIEIRGVGGKAAAQTRSGSIELRDVGGDIEARAHTGTITIESPHGGVYARTQTGSIRFSGKVEGDVALSAHTGSVTMNVDPQVPFFLDAESNTGSVRSDLPPRRRGGADGEGGGYKVRLRTHTGSIRIRRL
jgi:hypothetical protein